jgi:hypothetical protein
MKTVDIFEPPQGCSTGYCGPDGEDILAQVAQCLEWLESQGVQVNRYNLGLDPGAFAENAFVKSTLQAEGMVCLPMVVIDGTVAKKGGYLTRQDFEQALGRTLARASA